MQTSTITGLSHVLSLVGCPVGGIVCPQMLNRLFYGRIGYVWGVRVSAFVSLAVLVIGNILMVPNPPKLVPGQKPPIGKLLKDVPYILSMIGSVSHCYSNRLVFRTIDF